MISIRKYLEGVAVSAEAQGEPRVKRNVSDLLSISVDAWRSTLAELGRCCLEASPVTGPELEKKLVAVAERLAGDITPAAIAEADKSVQAGLQNWGRRTARHLQETAGEVKEILLVMTRAAEKVGERDRTCARQLNDVTASLKSIASLEDITQIRSSIEKSASCLKSSIDRMEAEGKAMIDKLQAQVNTFQAKLEEAEELAWRDSLTRLRSRLCVELQIERRIASHDAFCIALLDLDGFKAVNDAYGHVVGDEVLKQFAAELQSACRSIDVVGRWGGDEFLVVLDCDMTQAMAQMDRVRKWVCGAYTIERTCGPVKLQIDASIGLAEYSIPETMKDLLTRADQAMYEKKAEAHPEAGAGAHG